MMENKYSFQRFFSILIYTSLFTALVSAYPVWKYSDTNQINAFLLGFIISFINALIGYKLSLMAFGKSVKSFMVLVFGGMGIRLIIVIIFLLILLQFTSIEALSLTGSVFFFYTLFITIEIYFLHKMSGKTDSRKTENKV